MSTENPHKPDKMNVHVSDLEGDTLTVRFGQAPKVNEPQSVRITGSIRTPAEFYQKRKSEWDKKTMHVEAAADRGKIVLYCDPSDRLAPVVTGTMDLNPTLKYLGINTDKTYTRDEFVRMLKMNRSLFMSQQENLDLIDKIKTVWGKVERKIEKESDQRGNRRDLLDQTAKSDLPESFDLNCQVFVGGDRRAFSVDLCFNITSDFEFWLESPELKEYIDATITDEVADQVALFDEEIVVAYI